jgi:hypothetical protein
MGKDVNAILIQLNSVTHSTSAYQQTKKTYQYLHKFGTPEGA